MVGITEAAMYTRPAVDVPYASTVSGSNARAFRDAMTESAIAFVYAHSFCGYSTNMGGVMWGHDLIRTQNESLTEPKYSDSERIYFLEHPNFPRLDNLRFLLLAGCNSMGCWLPRPQDPTHECSPHHLLYQEYLDKGVDCVAGFHRLCTASQLWYFCRQFYRYAHSSNFPISYAASLALLDVCTYYRGDFGGVESFDFTSDIQLRPAKWGE